MGLFSNSALKTDYSAPKSELWWPSGLPTFLSQAIKREQVYKQQEAAEKCYTIIWA